MKRYKDTDIEISFAEIFNKSLLIDPASTQNQITQEEYNNFCLRLQSALKYYGKIDPTYNKSCLLALVAPFAVAFVLIIVLYKLFPESQITGSLKNLLPDFGFGPYLTWILFAIFLNLIVFTIQLSKRKSIKNFIYQENVHIWNPKDTNWIMAGNFCESFLVLQIADTESEGFESQFNTKASRVDLELSNPYLVPPGYQPVNQHTE